MRYYYPYKEVPGCHEIIKPGIQAKQTGFALLKLPARAIFESRTKDMEIVLVILKGSCRVETEGRNFDNLGRRKNVFSGAATAVYLPLTSPYRIIETCGQESEIAVLTAKAQKKYTPFVVEPEEVIINQRGRDNYQREVHDIIVENGENRVDCILVGETFSKPGHWSSYPPHKHDIYNPPLENKMEEIYHFKVNPQNGFGAQFIYTEDGSVGEVYAVKDGDTVFIPCGYHPVSAAPGYSLYYLWVLAGEQGRELIPRDDPNFAWINATK